MNRRFLLLVTVMVALLALAGGAAAQDEPAEAMATSPYIPGEPNDTFATATTVGGWHYFTSPTDVDFYRGDFPAGELVAYSWMNLKMSVFDGSQALIFDDANCDGGPSFAAPVEPGTYYLRLAPCPGHVFDESYYAGFYIEAYTDPELEPNDTKSQATPLLLPAYYDPYGGSSWQAAFVAAGDVDFYRFDGFRGLAVSISAHLADPYQPFAVNLTNAAGVAVPIVNSVAILPADGTFYLRARHPNHPNGTGAYSVGIGTMVSIEEAEPNDTAAQGLMIGYGEGVTGDLLNAADHDFYRFAGVVGDWIRLECDYYGPCKDTVTLRDPNGTAVPLGEQFNYQLTKTGVYSLDVHEVLFPGYGDSYRLRLYRLMGNEPNESMATAIDVLAGQTIHGLWDYECDDDWYRFQGRAGDIVGDLYDDRLYDAAGNLISNPWTIPPYECQGVVVLPADGTYYLVVAGDWFTGDDGGCNLGEYARTVNEALWVSADVDGLGGSATIKDEDIATRATQAGTWRLVFDGSDVGITQDLNAFEAMPNGSILMSLAATQTVPGLGKVMPQDIIRFMPTSLGGQTAGTFEWYLDGSDVGLTTTGEKIDAILMKQNIDTPLYISISGSGSVPRQSGGNLAVADEDLINFVGTAYGAATTGKFRMAEDGSTVPGMAAEDLNAATLLGQHRWWWLMESIFDSFTINGVRGGPRDVIFHGGPTIVRNLTDKRIDGLSIGPAWQP